VNWVTTALTTAAAYRAVIRRLGTIRCCAVNVQVQAQNVSQVLFVDRTRSLYNSKLSNDHWITLRVLRTGIIAGIRRRKT